MKIYFTDKIKQINTDTDIQLIEGEIFSWELISERVKIGKSCIDFFNDKLEYLNKRNNNVFGFVFGDVTSHLLYNSDGFGMIIRYAPLIKNK